MFSTSAIAGVPRRDRHLILACIALICTLAWVYLVHLGRQMSSEMEHTNMMAAMGMAMNTPWSAADIFFTFAMWVVMMIGMMAPAATPVILLFAAAQAKRSERAAPLTTALFGLGYISVWVGFSAAASIVQWALHQASLLSAAMSASSPRFAGAILVTAGTYQFTRWKSNCLTHCRSPLGFLMTHWHDGKLGAFHMGVRHGIYCIGCCWALMGLLFVLGVMNLAWVATLGALVLLEKAGPQGTWVARVCGGALIVWGIAVIV